MAQHLPVRRGSVTAHRGTAVRSRRAEMKDLYDRMGQLMQAVWRDTRRPFDPAWPPLAELQQTADAIVVEMDLPGVKKDDISVELSGDELAVTGDLKDGTDGQSKRRIRRSGHFEQRMVLPARVEADQATASLSDGVLTVTMPRSEAGKPHRVEVTSG
jgi:HSP20 family protein